MPPQGARSLQGQMGSLWVECALRLAPVCLLGLLLHRVLSQTFGTMGYALPFP
jgi:hypothetical protein